MSSTHSIPIKTTARKSTNSAKKVRGFVRKMYTRAHEAKAQGRPVAWVMGSVHGPIMKALDITPVYTENYATLCAAKKVEGAFIEKAEAEGYSNVICGYARNGLGYSALRTAGEDVMSDAPDGGMADPDVLLGSSWACDPRYKWYQATRRYYYDTPYFAYDDVSLNPAFVDDEGIKEHTIKYQVEQLHRLVKFLEDTLDKEMDWDLLKEKIKLQHETHKLWYEVYQMRKSVPCPLPTPDALNVMVPQLFMTAEEETFKFFQELRDEVADRMNNGIGSVPEEKFRLLWAGGLPPWHNMGLFNYFADKGAVFVMETAYFPGVPYDEFDVNSEDPIEVQQRRVWEKKWEELREARKVGGSLGAYRVLNFIKDYKVDGIVFHATKSCRASTIGQVHEKNILKNRIEIPALFLESDIVDSRDYSEAQTLQKIDAYLETLAARK